MMKISESPLSSKRAIVASSIALCLLALANVSHAQLTWDGGGADTNWSTGLNWDTDAAPVSGSQLIFSGNTEVSSNNDLAADILINGIQFTNDGSSAAQLGEFTLSGNRITLGGNIVTTAPTVASTVLTDTIDLDLILNGTRDVIANADSANDTEHNLTLNGIISGNGQLRSGGDGTVTISGDNTFTGGFRLGDGAISDFDGTTGNKQGFVIVNNSNALGTGVINSLGGQLQAGVAGINISNTIEIGGGGLHLGGSEDIELSGALNQNNGARTIGNHGTGTVTVSNGINLDDNGNPFNMTINDGNWNVSGVITGSSIFTFSGDGTLTLSGNNTFTGEMRFAGSLNIIDGVDIIEDTALVSHNAGTLRLADGTVDTFHTFNASAGTLDFAGTSEMTVLNDSTLRTVTIGTTGTLRTADGTVSTIIGGISGLADNESFNFDTQGSSEVTASNTINGGKGNGQINKSGSGTLKLTSDASQYGGGNRITNGTLEFSSIIDANVDDTSSLGNADFQDVLQIGSDSTAATLRMMGTNAKNSSNRSVQLGDAGGTIDIDDAGQTLTLSGVLSDDNNSGSLTKAGAGDLVLSGANTYTGTTTVSTGTLQIGDGGSTGTIGSGDVLNNSTLIFNRTGDYSVAQITGTGTTTVSAGNLSLDGASYDNAITVASGANITGEGSNAGNIVFQGATHEITANAGTAAALGTTGSGTLDITTVGAGGFTVNVEGTGSGVLTLLTYGGGLIGGDLSNFMLGTFTASARGAGSLQDTGTALTLDLGYVENTWTGAGADPAFWDINTTANWTNSADSVFQDGDDVIFQDSGVSNFGPTLQSNITAGTVTFTNTANAYTVSASGSEILTIDNELNTSGTAAVTIDTNLAGGSSGLTLNGTGDVTINGVISGSNGLTKVGTGAATIATAGTYTGETTINEGTLILETAAIRPSLTYTIGTGATLEMDTSNGNANSGVMNLFGNGTFKKSGPNNLNQTSAGATIELGADSLFHLEQGIYVFGGGGIGNWSNNKSDLQVDSGAEFRGSATSAVFDAMNGSGIAQFGGGVTLGVADGSGTFSGVIRDDGVLNNNLALRNSLTKLGTGAQTLSGNNTYTGATSVNEGQLNIGGTNASNITVAAGANLGGEGSTTGDITFQGSTHSLEIDITTATALGSTDTGSLDVGALITGGFNITSTGAVANSVAGAGGIEVLTYGAGGFTGSLDKFTYSGSVVRGTVGEATFADSGTAITLDIGNVANTWVGGDGTNSTFWDVGTTANWSNTSDTVFQNGDDVIFDDTALTTAPTLQADISVGSITFNNNTKVYTIASSGSEELRVGGTITSSGTGLSTIDSDITGAGAGLTFDGTGDLTVSGVISGSNSITKLGSGTTTLTGANDYTGDTIVSEGTLKLVGSGSNPNAQRAGFRRIVATGATLEFSGGSSVDTAILTGGGTFLKSGGGNAAFTSAGSTFSMDSGALFHIESGSLTFGGGGIGSYAGNLADLRVDSGAAYIGSATSARFDTLIDEGIGGTVSFGGGVTLGTDNGDGTFSGVIEDATVNLNGNAAIVNAVTKIGTGTQILNGANTYTGATIVNAGTLIVNGTLGGDITVATGAAVGGTATTTGSITFADGSSLSGVDGTAGPLTTTDATTGLDLSGVSAGGITVNIDVGGPGDFEILNYGGNATGFTAGSGDTFFTIGNAPAASARASASGFADNGTAITYNLGFAARTWAAAASTANWANGNTVDDNWIEGDFDFFDGDSVIFTNSDVNGNAPATDQVITLTTDVAPAAVEFTNNTNSYTINSTTAETITAVGGISIAGAADVILNANMIADGGITVSGAGNTTLGGDVTTSGTISNSGSGTLTANGVIAGSSIVDQSGTGTTILNGVNTYTGVTNVSDGTLTIGVDNAIDDNSILNHSGGNVTFANGVTETLHSVQQTGGTFFLGSGAATGAADLTLNNDSSFTNIQVGTNSFLRLADDVNVTIVDISQLGGGDSLTFDTGTGSLAVVNGAINSGDGSGALNKDGAGILRLTNNNSAFGGGTRITEGTLEFTSIANVGGDDDAFDSSLGNAQNINVLQIGSKTAAATLRMINTNAKNTSDRLVQLGDAGGTIDIVEASQTLRLTGIISNDTANSGTNGSLTKAGAGTLILSGANTYSGSTTVAAGTLQVDTGGTLGDTNGDVIVNSTLILNSDDDVTYSGVFSDDGTIIHSGAGTTTLSGSNTFDGTLSITDGTVLIDGNSSAASATVSVDTGATLGGSGTIGGDVSVSGTLSAATAGASGSSTVDDIGTLTLNGNLSAGSGATWLVDLNNASSGTSDLIALGDISTATMRAIDLGNFNLVLNDFNGFTPGTGNVYDIATYSNSAVIGSTFSGLTNGGTVTGLGGGQYTINYGFETSPGSGNYSIRLTAVPEPTTFLLLLPLLLAGFWMMRRRKLAQQLEEEEVTV